MNQVKTAVILSAVAVVMVGVLVYLNRDKFGKKSETPAEPAEPAE